jgi:hypothetical protein
MESPHVKSRPLQPKSPGISTLNEKPLHESLKNRYAKRGDRFEVPVDGSIVDIVRGNLLIEIQTRNFVAIRRKLEKLVIHHPVRLVYPIPHEKWIIRLAGDGYSQLSRRKSPKLGTFEQVFDELVYLPKLLINSNFSLELLLIQEEEVRRYDGIRGWRRRGWVTQERRLLKVMDRRIFQTPADMGIFIPSTLDSPFSASDLADVSGTPRRLTQKIVYCLRLMGCITPVEKRGNSILYTRSNSLNSTDKRRKLNSAE